METWWRLIWRNKLRTTFSIWCRLYLSDFSMSFCVMDLVCLLFWMTLVDCLLLYLVFHFCARAPKNWKTCSLASCNWVISKLIIESPHDRTSFWVRNHWLYVVRLICHLYWYTSEHSILYCECCDSRNYISVFYVWSCQKFEASKAFHIQFLYLTLFQKGLVMRLLLFGYHRIFLSLNLCIRMSLACRILHHSFFLFQMQCPCGRLLVVR